MREKHIAAVIAAGAQTASLIKFENEENDRQGAYYEARYIFASRAAYEDYLTRHAPRLRAEGAALFPPGADFIYSRNIAIILSRAA